MIHIKATISFDKEKDASELEAFQGALFSYNFLCSMSGMKPIKTEYIDCGNTIEIRADDDLDLSNWSKFQENTEFMSQLLYRGSYGT